MPEQNQEELNRILKGPHEYHQGSYRTAHPKDAVYPLGMFKARTTEEVETERENLPKSMWLDPDVDLIQLTGMNYPKKVQAWEEYVTRPHERVVNNKEEEAKATKDGWIRSLVEAKKAK